MSELSNKLQIFMFSLCVAQPLWVNGIVSGLKEGYIGNDPVYLASVLRVSLSPVLIVSLTFHHYSEVLLHHVVGSSVAAVSGVQAPPLSRPPDQTMLCLSH